VCGEQHGGHEEAGELPEQSERPVTSFHQVHPSIALSWGA
jgi:hypothetical protein